MNRLALLFTIVSLAARAHAATVLVEAESFKTPGGWVLDTQFIETMGSPYLMAHGLGTPVGDATTSVKLPQAELDRLNYLHVLHHTGPRLFTHTVVNHDGDLLRRETYEALGGPRPGLKKEQDGRVTVSSAERVPRADDLPAFQPAPAPTAPLATP